MIIFIDNKTMDEIKQLTRDGYTLASFSNTTIFFLSRNMNFNNVLMIVNEKKMEPPSEPYIGVYDDWGDEFCVEKFENIIIE